MKLEYVLITAARNEELYIEKTLQSVVSQTILPKKWIIVSDGSTDRTDEIVKKYLKDHAWMELIRMPEHDDRQFAAKVHAFNAGYRRVNNIQYDIIGNIDADISFGQDHFEFLLGKFAEYPQLGVAGTAFVEDSSVAYNYTFTNIEHVSGQCQLFRRACFEQIGGYIPIKGGGIDWTAVTTARMKGWKTRTFPEKTFVHHRKMGTGNNGTLGAWVKLGRKDYILGGHPLWEVFRALYQMKKKPYIIGGVLLFAGYASSLLRRVKLPISTELIQFNRKEQINRLKKIIQKIIS